MKSIFFLLTCLALASAAVADPRPGKPENGDPVRPLPNIIFLLTDDQRDNTFGAMGHPFVKTPHVDTLLEESVRFTNAYIAEPVCSPSRVSYLTGMHERIHGVGFTSGYELTEAQWEQSYPALLRNAGYHTGFVGKFGVEYYSFKGKAAEIRELVAVLKSTKGLKHNSLVITSIGENLT